MCTGIIGLHSVADLALEMPQTQFNFEAPPLNIFTTPTPYYVYVFYSGRQYTAGSKKGIYSEITFKINQYKSATAWLYLKCC